MKTFDLDSHNVFDEWRACYNDLTSDEQNAFYDAIELRYPHQQSFTKSNFDRFFNGQQGSVLEIGGWKGELAQYCLSTHRIHRWHNIELCSNAILKNVCTEARYKVTKPDKYDWFNKEREVKYDHFVCAHMIEHITDEQLINLLNYIKGIPRVLLEAPISMDKNDWTGYFGTHILNMGWSSIIEIMRLNGYKETRYNQHCYMFEVI